MYLRIEHRTKDFKKSWKLESGSKPFSVGHSRYADIRLDKNHAGIMGLLECHQGQWNYVHLTAPSSSGLARQIPIQGPTVIPLKEGELHISPFERQIQLFDHRRSGANQTEGRHLWIWLIWKRNKKIWYSEFVPSDKIIYWPHNKRQINLTPSNEWNEIESEGVTLSYRLTNSPNVNGLLKGAFNGIFDPSVRPYLVGAMIACLLTGLVSWLGQRTADHHLAQNRQAVIPSESTLIRLEKKVVPVQPKNAVAKALAQMNVPQTNSSPKPTSNRTLGRVFSQIGKHSLKNIATGTGPKTISVANADLPPASTAKTFKVLGSLGSGTGLHPSQFTKGLKKDGGLGLGNGELGGSQLGQISQGTIGQGDIGLLHKESQITGGLDRDVIAKYIQSQKGKILFCYERQLSANPGLFGKVSVKFQIAPTGAVETSQITESTLGNNSVEGCLLQLIAQWQFPKPVGGTRVLVSYPFVFKSLN